MNVLLHGCNGRMGEVMTRVIGASDGVRAVCGVDPSRGSCDNGIDGTSDGKVARPYPVYRSFSEVTESVDVIIDFSHRSCLRPLVDFGVAAGIPLVIGTTGFTDEDKLLVRAAAATIPILSAANMSLGVSVLILLARAAAAALGQSFDIEIIEKHHNRKVDAPSGTALAIADAIRACRDGDLEYQYGRQPDSGKRRTNEIGIHAVRGGAIVGEHSVIFAGHGETIEISHSALSRDLFALGALRAARFIIGQAPGLYGMEDVIQDRDRHLEHREDRRRPAFA